MVKIRLSRTGKRGAPSYRIVVIEADRKREGKVIEAIGHYNPLTDPATVEIDRDRYAYWLSQGAKPTLRVAKLIEGKKQ